MYTLVLDTETSGLPPRGMKPEDPNYPRIVELAVSLIDREGIEVAAAGFIIKPDGWTIPESLTKIHGISTEQAQEIGVPIALAVASLTNLARVAGEIVGHNIMFDIGMARSELHRLGRSASLADHSFVCTAELGEPVCQLPPTERMKAAGYGDKFKKPNLTELHRFLFNEDFSGAHRALADVRACARCLIEIRRRAAL
jgi:DNA polymerase-3 subunit epsilon